MKKIVYLYTVLDESYKEKYPGINKKIFAQVKALNRGGLDTKLEIIKYESKLKRALPLQTSSVQWKNLKVWEEFDGLYLRYSTSDYQMIKWLKHIKKQSPEFKVVVEIPTYPYDSELNTRNRIVISRDIKYRQQLQCGVDRLVINGKDKEVFGIPTILTANGVDLEEVRVRNPIELEGGKINICFVAAFAMWHGADRAIEGLKNYYKNGGTRNIQLHFVGNGDDSIMNPLKESARDESVSEHISFYGFLDGEELSKIYDKSQLAFASLGLHRLHIDAPSTLKSREYLARGIPIIYSSIIQDFEEHPVDFALQISTDDKPVDFFEIEKYYDGLMDKNTVSDLTNRIREYAAQYVSIDKTMAPIIDFFNS